MAPDDPCAVFITGLTCTGFALGFLSESGSTFLYAQAFAFDTFSKRVTIATVEAADGIGAAFQEIALGDTGFLGIWFRFDLGIRLSLGIWPNLGVRTGCGYTWSILFWFEPGIRTG